MTADENLGYTSGQSNNGGSTVPGGSTGSSIGGGSISPASGGSTTPSKPQEIPASANNGLNETVKKPFADKEVSLTGMTSSVLNPKSEDERSRIEREIARRKQKINGESKAAQEKTFKIAAVVLLILIVLFAGYKTLPFMKSKVQVLKKIVYKATKSVNKKDNQEIKNLGENKVVFERNFRLTVKSNSAADLAVLLVGKDPKKVKREEGKLISKDNEGVKTWEFSMVNLRTGTYNYKLFLKNTKTNKFIFSVASFDIK